MTPVFVTHIIDEENVGDRVCCPARARFWVAADS
jgi:hypothetical protein